MADYWSQFAPASGTQDYFGSFAAPGIDPRATNPATGLPYSLLPQGADPTAMQNGGLSAAPSAPAMQQSASNPGTTYPVMPTGGGFWGAANRATNGGMPAPNGTMTSGGMGSALGSAFGGWGNTLGALGGMAMGAGSAAAGAAGAGGSMKAAQSGETRLINGQPARWDGTGWLALSGAQ